MSFADASMIVVKLTFLVGPATTAPFPHVSGRIELLVAKYQILYRKQSRETRLGDLYTPRAQGVDSVLSSREVAYTMHSEVKNSM